MSVEKPASLLNDGKSLIPSYLLPNSMTLLPDCKKEMSSDQLEMCTVVSQEDDSSICPPPIKKATDSDDYSVTDYIWENVLKVDRETGKDLESDGDTLIDDDSNPEEIQDDGDEDVPSQDEEEEDEDEDDDDMSLDSTEHRFRGEIDASTDCDGFKVNIILTRTSYMQARILLCREDDLDLIVDPLKKNIVIARRMVQEFFKGGFHQIYGSACRVYPPDPNTTLYQMIDKFSVKKGSGYKVNKQVPESVVGQEILLCVGPLEIAMWPRSVDVPTDQELTDEDNGQNITIVNFVNALQLLGYSGAELNPKCASTKKALKPGCLKYSHITLEDVLIAIFASRPLFFSICGMFGARVGINTPGGAYENLWMWKQCIIPTFQMKKHLVRLDLAYSIPQNPTDIVQMTAKIDNVITEGVKTDEIFSADAIGRREARCSRVFYQGFTAARDQRAGGVTLNFECFSCAHSPSQVSKVKFYFNLAHLVKMNSDIINGDRNIKDQLSSMSVRKVQTAVLNQLTTFHKAIDFINKHGASMRVESTIISCYEHSSDTVPLDPLCVSLKDCGEEEWITNHYWTIDHYRRGNFNIQIECVGQANSMIAPFYRDFTLMQIALRRDQKTLLKDIPPKDTNLIYLSYLYTMLRSFTGYAGSRHHHAIKSYTEAPYGTYPDYSGTLFLLNHENEMREEAGTYIDPIRHTPSEYGEKILRFEQRHFLMTSMNEVDEQRANELLNHGSQYNDFQLANEMDWFENRLKSIVETRQALLAQALDTKALKSQELRDLCGKHYQKIGITRLQNIFGLNTVNRDAALREGSCILLYNLIPFRGPDATFEGFNQLVATIAGTPNQSDPQVTASNLPYLEAQIDTLDGLTMQMIYLWQDMFEPLPSITNEELEERRRASGNRTVVTDDDNQNDSDDSSASTTDSYAAAGNVGEEVTEATLKDANHVPTIEEIIRVVKSVPYTEPWMAIVISKLKGKDVIFKPNRRGKRRLCLKLENIDEDTPMLEMPEEVVNNLNAMYSYLSNKKKVDQLANKMNIFTADLRKDKNATSMDIVDRILRCYKKKFPDIDSSDDGVTFGDPDEIDDSDDEEYENNGYGEDGDIPASELNEESQQYLASLEDRTRSYSVRSTAGNQTARAEWLEVHEENQQLQDIMNTE